jgi:hypothetical protein
VRDLLATCLGICVKEPKNEPIIWVENLAGVRIAKIKPGIYSIKQLYNELSTAAKIIGHDQYIIYIRQNSENKPIFVHAKVKVPTKASGYSYHSVNLYLKNDNTPLSADHTNLSDTIIMIPTNHNNCVLLDQIIINYQNAKETRMTENSEFWSMTSLNEQFNISIIGKIFGFDVENIVSQYLDNYNGNYLGGLSDIAVLPDNIIKMLNRFYNAVNKKKQFIKVNNEKIDIKLCAAGLGCYNIYNSIYFHDVQAHPPGSHLEAYLRIIPIYELCKNRQTSMDIFIKHHPLKQVIFDYAKK